MYASVVGEHLREKERERNGRKGKERERGGYTQRETTVLPIIRDTVNLQNLTYPPFATQQCMIEYFSLLITSPSTLLMLMFGSRDNIILVLKIPHL